ncbi:peptidylprolyl isomerase [Bellilinea sp.]|uniref:peptidylprolyl isomerase n=1 Tax=Bellilinea sp. TaxID=2838785 RepID=UPI002ADE065B|nr:peptidylprolyl isomerase [Bellilinea sp.]
MLGVLVLALLAGCNNGGEPVLTSSPVPSDQTPQPPARPTHIPTVTATPEPLALIVNGEGIPRREFEASLLQLQQADQELGIQRSEEERIRLVVNDLIEQTLLAQAARASGFAVDDAQLENRIQQLIAETGDQQVFQDWMNQNGYEDLMVFRFALRRAMEAARQRDQLAASLPAQVEQVKARQIVVRLRSTADSLYRQLQAGADFATLAFQYDPLTGGDLGWFPRGFLTIPAVEEAAFSLQPGEYSNVIESTLGYHIIQVEERDESYPLSSEARLTLQEKLIQEWLNQQRAAAQIEILYP